MEMPAMKSTTSVARVITTAIIVRRIGLTPASAAAPLEAGVEDDDDAVPVLFELGLVDETALELLEAVERIGVGRPVTVRKGGTRVEYVTPGAVVSSGCVGLALAVVRSPPPTMTPGLSGCVSRAVRSSSFHRICSAGPTVNTALPNVEGPADTPQMPPRKSVVSDVHENPLWRSKGCQ